MNNFNEYEEVLIKNMATLQKDNINCKNRKYDAILIDEAQDFKKEWFDLLLYFLSENNEILLVADDKQNLYDRDISWIKESMGGYGYNFKGAWGVLKECKRLDRFPNLIYESNRFFDLFLKDYLQEHPDKNFGTLINTVIQQNENVLNLQPLIWKNINKNNLYETILYYCEYFINNQYKPKDISILVANKDMGKNIKYFINKNNIKTQDMFNNKEQFSLEDNYVTISTVNSFKGIENKVIIFISHNNRSIQNDFKTYVALTRAKEALVVLNENRKYFEYAKGWNKYN